MSLNELDRLIVINAIRRVIVSQAFEEGIGERAFILVAQYPYTFIGEIIEVEGDFVLLEAETTNVVQLDGNVFRIHVDDIAVFFIENEKWTIPDIC
ncbi:hypothetical protein [Bacillus vallismortis]|uniref:hypothetical protein n=1 Tax=Bacillus vallismortis TaxID=72361 RepID=UPI000C2A4A37|nr:hypothetical protein [Bacillus vallismortis]PJZ00011.1 hypothetical protein CPT06_13795 [Bacillus vallismortis]